MEINGDLKHVGDSATIESTIEVDYDKFKNHISQFIRVAMKIF